MPFDWERIGEVLTALVFFHHVTKHHKHKIAKRKDKDELICKKCKMPFKEIMEDYLND